MRANHFDSHRTNQLSIIQIQLKLPIRYDYILGSAFSQHIGFDYDASDGDADLLQTQTTNIGLINVQTRPARPGPLYPSSLV